MFLSHSLQTFQRLNKLGISQSRANVLNLMDDVGKELLGQIKQKMNERQSLRIVFDNFDFKILVNVITKQNRNSDIHWIGQYATFDRVPSDHLDDKHPLVSNIDHFDNAEYLLSEKELKEIKTQFTVLLARILFDFFPCLQHLKTTTCDHIKHK
jgi:hypothetical protein